MVVTAAERGDLFDHRLLLVDLNRVDAPVGAFVAVGGDRLSEAFVEVRDRTIKDVAETQQHRHADAAFLEAGHHFHQADIEDAAFVRLQLDHDLAGGVGIEEAGTPIADAIEFGALADLPAFKGFRLHR